MNKSIILKVFFAVLIIGVLGICCKTKAFAADPYINYNDSNLKYMWQIDRESLQTFGIDPETKKERRMPIQNFSRVPGTNTFFLTQHYEADTYLYRCTLYSDGILSATDHIVLKGYGHGESVEVTDYDASTGIYTIWIGANANKSNKKDYWSTSIARVKYKVDMSMESGAKLVESKTITNAHIAGGASGKANRASVSIAEDDDSICFCTQINNNSGDWYYIVYSFSDIDKALNKKTGSTTLSGLGVQYKAKFKMIDNGLPNSSFQAIDIDGVGSNNKMLFLSSGRHDTKTQIITQYLYTNGGNITQKYSYIINTSSAPAKHFLHNAEIEGIKIYPSDGKDYIYILFKQEDATYGKIYRYPVR